MVGIFKRRKILIEKVRKPAIDQEKRRFKKKKKETTLSTKKKKVFRISLIFFDKFPPQIRGSPAFIENP